MYINYASMAFTSSVCFRMLYYVYNNALRDEKLFSTSKDSGLLYVRCPVYWYFKWTI